MSGQSVHRPICPDGRAIRDQPCEQPCPERSRFFVLLATIVASAMAFIDGTIVTIALPTLQQDFQASFGALQWIVNGYSLMLGGLILVGGAAGDRFGRRRVFVTGIVIFALASVLCAMSLDVVTLVIARALQGVGAALLVPQSLAIIAASFPKSTRGRAIGIWSGASAITTALGPALGGVLIDWFDWRAIFWLNLPFAAIALWASVVHVPESRDEQSHGALDWRGATLAITGFGLLTVALTLGAEGNTSVILLIALSLVGLIALGEFVVVERRQEAPLVPLRLFNDPVFNGANLMTLFLYGALSGVLFLLPFDLIERRGLSATAVGLTLLPLGLIIGTLSRFAGEWADRVGPRLPLVIGSAIVTVAAGVFALGLGSYWIGAVVPVVLLSLGMAIVVAPLTTAVMNAVPDESSGAASGVNNAAGRLAGLFAIAILGAVASATFNSAIGGADGSARFGALPELADPSRASLEAAFGRAYQIAMVVAVAFSAIATAIAFAAIPDRALTSANDEDRQP